MSVLSAQAGTDYIRISQREVLFHNPFLKSSLRTSIFRRKLLDPLLFRAMADENLTVLLGEDAVVDSLDKYSFAGYAIQPRQRKKLYCELLVPQRYSLPES